MRGMHIWDTIGYHQLLVMVTEVTIEDYGTDTTKEASCQEVRISSGPLILKSSS